MSDEHKLKHLEFLQGIINRMASNSFLLKGWCVTLVSALFALGVQDSHTKFIWLAFFPVIMFWILDAYFLRQERLFRKKYDQVSSPTETEINFSMNTSPFVNQKNYDMRQHQKYENLYRHVTNQPSVIRPEIGDIIDLPNNSIPNLFNSQIQNTGELEQENIPDQAKVCIVYDRKSKADQKKVQELQEILKQYQIECVPDKDDLIG